MVAYLDVVVAFEKCTIGATVITASNGILELYMSEDIII